jgi:hypothetical protein
MEPDGEAEKRELPLRSSIKADLIGLVEVSRVSGISDVTAQQLLGQEDKCRNADWPRQSMHN